MASKIPTWEESKPVTEIPTWEDSKPITPEQDPRHKMVQEAITGSMTSPLVPAFEFLMEKLGPGRAASTARKYVEEGALAGFSDELRAIPAAVTDTFIDLSEGKKVALLKSYQKHRDLGKATREALGEEHPIAKGLGIAGGIGMGLAIPAGHSLKAATAIGALEGAVAGLGMSEADLTEGEWEKAGQDTLIGAGIGAGGVGILGGTLKLGKKSIDGINKMLKTEGVDIAEGGARLLKKNADAEKELGNSVMSVVTGNPHSHISFDKVLNAVAPKVRQKSVKKLQRELKTDGIEVTDDIIGRSIVDGEFRDFARFLGSKKLKDTDDAVDFLRSEAKSKGKGFMATRWSAYRKTQNELRYIKDAGLREDPTAWSGIRKLGYLIQDGKYVLADLDRKFGTQMELISDRLSNSFNQYTLHMKEFVLPRQRQLKEILSKVDNDDLYDYLDTGAVAKGADIQSFKEARRIFDELAESAQGLGIPIQKRADYVPYQMKSGERFVTAIEEEAEKLADKSFKEIKDSDLVRSLEIFSGTKITNEARFNKVLSDARNLDVRDVGKRSKAKAALERTAEDVPGFIREKDMRHLLTGWTRDTFRHAFMREGVAELGDQVKILSKLDDKTGAEYVTRMIQDINGVRKSAVAGMFRRVNMSNKIALERKAVALEQAGKTRRAELVRSVKDIPDLISAMTYQMYPNFLGANLRAPIRNLTQPFVMTAPEVQGAYGQQLAWRSLLDTTRRTGKIGSDLQEAGKVGARFTGEGQEYLRNGLRSTWLYDKGSRAIEKSSDIAMTLYTKSDEINRHVTMNMAKRLSKDLLNGHEGAQRYADALPGAYRIELKKLMQTKRWDKVEDLVADHLLSRTQFNYNRIQMSELGRTLGPMFSMFTKWPTSIAGDVYQKAKRGEMQRVFTKYFGPVAALGLIGSMVPSPEDSPRAKKMIGAKGLDHWAPFYALSSIGDMSIASSPLWEYGTDIKAAAVSDNPRERVPKALGNAMRAFTPGYVWYRFLSDDLPTLATGEEPGE